MSDTKLVIEVSFDGDDDQAKGEFLASQKMGVIRLQLDMAMNDRRIVEYTVDGQ